MADADDDPQEGAPQDAGFGRGCAAGAAARMGSTSAGCPGSGRGRGCGMLGRTRMGGARPRMGHVGETSIEDAAEEGVPTRTGERC